MTKTGFNECLYNVSVDHNTVDSNDIVNIHKY